MTAGLLMASLSGCQTTQQAQSTQAATESAFAQGASSAPQRADVRFPVQSLDPEAAAALIVNEHVLFQSAIDLAAQRPRAKQELVEVSLRVTQPDTPDMITPMRFYPMPLGLSYTLQDRSPITDTSINVFGAASVVYINSASVQKFGASVTTPDQVRLVKGRLFTVDSDFSLELKFAHGDTILQNCVVTEKILANTIHRKLAGQAARLHCTTLPDVATNDIWYLEDYARYLPYKNFFDEGAVTAFSIGDVKLAPSP